MHTDVKDHDPRNQPDDGVATGIEQQGRDEDGGREGDRGQLRQVTVGQLAGNVRAKRTRCADQAEQSDDGVGVVVRRPG